MNIHPTISPSTTNNAIPNGFAAGGGGINNYSNDRYNHLDSLISDDCPPSMSPGLHKSPETWISSSSNIESCPKIPYVTAAIVALISFLVMDALYMYFYGGSFWQKQIQAIYGSSSSFDPAAAAAVANGIHHDMMSQHPSLYGGIQSHLAPQQQHLKQDQVAFNWKYAPLVYAVMVASVVFFVVYTFNQSSMSVANQYGCYTTKTLVLHGLLYGAVLGFCIYGVFNTTNAFIFKEYNLTTVAVDTLWGTFMFAVTAMLTMIISSKFDITQWFNRSNSSSSNSAGYAKKN